jgi:hypothetical protein
MPHGGAVAGAGDATVLFSNIDWRAVMGWPLIVGVIAAAAGRGADATALVFGGFGVAFGLSHLAGAVVSPRWTLTAHIDYLYALAFWLPWVALARTLSATLMPKLVTPLAVAATMACLAYGLVDVRAYVTMWRPFNVDNGVLARFLRELDAGPADLVVTPVHGFKITRPPLYWETSWVPLAVGSTVLYTSGAAMFQPAGSPVTADRLAAYLYLGGEDAVATRERLEAPYTTTEQHFLVGHARQGQLQSARRAQALGETRDELVPRLDALAAGSLPAPIAAANRVIVADYVATPLFDPARIEAWLQIDSVSRQGAWIIRVGRPRRPAARPAA